MSSFCNGTLESRSGFEKAAFFFWLSGPFVLLIERSPADLWLSTIALAFLAKSIADSSWLWLRETWVRLAILFALSCLISSLFSSLSAFAVGQTLLWLRFPLFACAVTFWLCRSQADCILFVISVAMATCVMFGILTIEIFINGWTEGRLIWPYGDKVTGNYLTKVGLPSFIVAVGLFMRTKDRFVMVLVGAFALLSLLFGVLTGERVNLLTKIFAGLLVLLIYRRYFTNTVPLILLFGMLSSILFLSNSDLFSRFFSSFYHTLPIFEESPYRKVYVAAINVFNQHPLLGIGPATYEQLCPQHVTQNELSVCQPHPHHYFLQAFTEVGLFGGIIFFVFT